MNTSSAHRQDTFYSLSVRWRELVVPERVAIVDGVVGDIVEDLRNNVGPDHARQGTENRHHPDQDGRQHGQRFRLQNKGPKLYLNQNGHHHHWGAIEKVAKFFN